MKYFGCGNSVSLHANNDAVSWYAALDFNPYCVEMYLSASISEL